MNAIDQNRLLQMRAAIVSQNQALQRAAGLESQAPSSFTQSLSDAVQAVNAQQAKASELSAAYGLGSLTLTVGGVAHNLTITASNNSLAGLADAINATGSGVRASVVSDQGQFRLVLKGETGTAKAFSLAADTGADPALAGLVGGLTLSQPASDAIIRVDGVEYNRPTNTITDIVPGVSLTLKKAEIGVAVSLGSVRPADALKQTVSDFVTVFNQLQTSLKEARQAVGGAGNLRALDRQLTALVSKALTGNAGINSWTCNGFVPVTYLIMPPWPRMRAG
ncbi:flagellar filament capping protein FliD, partial [Sphingorhabdus buctiana]|jgi:flagellar hook-associated protein 2